MTLKEKLQKMARQSREKLRRPIKAPAQTATQPLLASPQENRGESSSKNDLHETVDTKRERSDTRETFYSAIDIEAIAENSASQSSFHQASSISVNNNPTPSSNQPIENKPTSVLLQEKLVLVRQLREILNQNIAHILQPSWLTEEYLNYKAELPNSFKAATDMPFVSTQIIKGTPFLVARFIELYEFLDQLEEVLTDAIPIFTSTNLMVNITFHLNDLKKLVPKLKELFQQLDHNYDEFAVLIEFTNYYRRHVLQQFRKYSETMEEGDAAKLFHKLKIGTNKIIAILQSKTGYTPIIESVSPTKQSPLLNTPTSSKQLSILPQPSPEQINESPTYNAIISALYKMNSRLEDKRLIALINALDDLIKNLNVSFNNQNLFIFKAASFSWYLSRGVLKELDKHQKTIEYFINLDEFEPERSQCQKQIEELLLKVDLAELFLGLKSSTMSKALSPLHIIMRMLNPNKITPETVHDVANKVTDGAFYIRVHSMMSQSDSRFSRTMLLQDNTIRKLQELVQLLISRGGLKADKKQKLTGKANASTNTDASALENTFKYQLADLQRATNALAIAVVMLERWYQAIEKETQEFEEITQLLKRKDSREKIAAIERAEVSKTRRVSVNIAQASSKAIEKEYEVIEVPQESLLMNEKRRLYILANGLSFATALSDALSLVQMHQRIYRVQLKSYLAFLEEMITSNAAQQNFSIRDLLEQSNKIIRQAEKIVAASAPIKKEDDIFVVNESIKITQGLISQVRALVNIVKQMDAMEKALLLIFGENLFFHSHEENDIFQLAAEQLINRKMENDMAFSKIAEKSIGMQLNFITQRLGLVVLPTMMISMEEQRYNALRLARIPRFWISDLREVVYNTLRYGFRPESLVALDEGDFFRFNEAAGSNETVTHFFKQANKLLDLLDCLQYVAVWLKDYNETTSFQKLATIKEFLRKTKQAITLFSELAGNLPLILQQAEQLRATTTQTIDQSEIETKMLWQHSISDHVAMAFNTVVGNNQSCMSAMILSSDKPGAERAVMGARVAPLVTLFDHFDKALNNDNVMQFINLLGKNLRKLRAAAMTEDWGTKVIRLIRAGSSLVENITEKNLSEFIAAMKPQDKAAIRTIFLQITQDAAWLKDFCVAKEQEWQLKPGLIVKYVDSIIKFIAPLEPLTIASDASRSITNIPAAVNRS